MQEIALTVSTNQRSWNINRNTNDTAQPYRKQCRLTLTRPECKGNFPPSVLYGGLNISDELWWFFKREKMSYLSIDLLTDPLIAKYQHSPTNWFAISTVDNEMSISRIMHFLYNNEYVNCTCALCMEKLCNKETGKKDSTGLKG